MKAIRLSSIEMRLSVMVRKMSFCLALVLAAPAAILAPDAAHAVDPGHLILRERAPTPRGFAGLCGQYPWLCAVTRGPAAPDTRTLALAQRINLRVNRGVPQIDDAVQYGVADHWALPTARGGDCEDLAMLKKKELVALGVPPQSLLLATVLDRQRENHAVLVLRTRQGDYVLDNLDNTLLPWAQTGYTFLAMQDPATPAHWDRLLQGGMLAMQVASN
ncbi:transglutaminase-like cysteine peptidase [Acidimangrovimonas sediminis]|uniref:transglutaminase-like cysteine peptidase n=1 Tax=Acidimangrovimonas sediminis TaxID=2056283 RepID=UPI000C80BA00|nr:transglutaminase-like cysteine peptidase [Acidimangrovimonas sediminis]